MKSIVIAGLTLSIVAYLGFGFFLYVFQRSFLYHPSPEVITDRYQTLTINQLKIWHVNPGQPKALIYFGGNSEGVEHNLEVYEGLFPDFTLYFVNYRGFGGSPGKPSELGLYEDALAIFDQLPEHESITVVGRSLGSGVATYLASKRQFDKLVLVTPYDSITRVAQKVYPMYPAEIILRDKFESINRAADIESDVLIVIAALDTVIPPSHSYRLAEGFTAATVETTLIEDANHRDIHSNQTYQKQLKSFLTI